jgi:iron complex outermembrane receptor protein
VTHDFSNGVELLGELGFSRNEVTDNPQSPSYPDLTFPIISANHPSNPIGVPLVWLGRPFAFGYPSPLAPRENNTVRASLSLNGSLNNDWTWDAAVTHSSNEYRSIQPDTIASRLRDAFAGQGGPGGDEYYDPFIPENNSQALYDYLSYNTDSKRTTDLTVIDGVMSGDLIALSSGETIEIAVGAQLRREGYKTETDDLYEIRFGSDGVAIPVDLIFLGGISELDESRTGYSAFIETKTPMANNVELTTAVRYENLDSGSSVDPKLALRWQASEIIAIRASASTAFRQPSLSQINAQIVQLVDIQDYNADGTAKGGSAFRRVTQSGSSELKAEESDNFNLGVIVTPNENLDLKLDYWSVDYTDLITVEDPQGKLLADINGPDIVRTETGTLSGIIVDYFNSSNVAVSGIDFESRWDFSDNWTVGVNVTQMIEYDITLPTGDTVEALGKFNGGNFARSLPETKANMNIAWSNENKSATLNMNYVSSYKNVADDVDSYKTIDAQYAVVFDSDGDADTIKLSIGVKNLLDEDPPRVIDGANYSYDAKQHSPLGRSLYLKVKFQF